MKFSKSTFYIAFAILFLNSTNVFSQHVTSMEEAPGLEVNAKKPVGFQMRGGLTFSNIVAMDGSDVFRGHVRVGYNINALLDINLGKNVFLQTGAGIISKGAVLNGDGSDVTMDATYLRVPMYVGGRFNIAGYRQNFATLAGGLYGAYGIGGTTKEDRAWGDGMATFGTNGLKPFDMGLGLEITFELQRVVFAMTGEYGFTPVTDKYDGVIEPSGLNWLNQSFSLSIGYKF